MKPGHAPEQSESAEELQGIWKHGPGWIRALSVEGRARDHQSSQSAGADWNGGMLHLCGAADPSSIPESLLDPPSLGRGWV